MKNKYIAQEFTIVDTIILHTNTTDKATFLKKLAILTSIWILILIIFFDIEIRGQDSVSLSFTTELQSKKDKHIQCSLKSNINEYPEHFIHSNAI